MSDKCSIILKGIDFLKEEYIKQGVEFLYDADEWNNFADNQSALHIEVTS